MYLTFQPTLFPPEETDSGAFCQTEALVPFLSATVPPGPAPTAALTHLRMETVGRKYLLSFSRAISARSGPGNSFATSIS